MRLFREDDTAGEFLAVENRRCDWGRAGPTAAWLEHFEMA
jgi:hypothetical protein